MVNLDKNIFLDAISKSELPTSINSEHLDSLLTKYPVFNGLHLINAVILHENDPQAFNNQLTNIATKITDRAILHDIAHQNKFVFISTKTNDLKTEKLISNKNKVIESEKNTIDLKEIKENKKIELKTDNKLNKWDSFSKPKKETDFKKNKIDDLKIEPKKTILKKENKEVIQKIKTTSDIIKPEPIKIEKKETLSARDSAFKSLNEDLFKGKLSQKTGKLTDKEQRRVDAMKKLQEELFKNKPIKRAAKKEESKPIINKPTISKPKEIKPVEIKAEAKDLKGVSEKPISKNLVVENIKKSEKKDSILDKLNISKKIEKDSTKESEIDIKPKIDSKKENHAISFKENTLAKILKKEEKENKPLAFKEKIENKKESIAKASINTIKKQQEAIVEKNTELHILKIRALQAKLKKEKDNNTPEIKTNILNRFKDTENNKSLLDTTSKKSKPNEKDDFYKKRAAHLKRMEALKAKLHAKSDKKVYIKKDNTTTQKIKIDVENKQTNIAEVLKQKNETKKDLTLKQSINSNRAKEKEMNTSLESVVVEKPTKTPITEIKKTKAELFKEKISILETEKPFIKKDIKDQNILNNESKHIVTKKPNKVIKPNTTKTTENRNTNFLDWLKKKEPTIKETKTTSKILIKEEKNISNTNYKQKEQIIPELKPIVKKPIVDKIEKEEETFERSSAIEVEMHQEIKNSKDPLDAFINKQISRKKTTKKINSTFGIISETLADILVLQQNYNEAINVYNELSLKYPQKSIYFARQIEKIKTYL